MSDERVTFDPPEPIYTLFNTSRDHLPETVVVNEALFSFTYVNIFPWHLYDKNGYHNVADNEMPTLEESELVNEIGDLIEQEVLNGKNEFGAPNALFLARSTWNRVTELAFQVDDPDTANESLQALIGSKEWQ